MADRNAARRRREARLSGRNEIVKAGCEYALDAQTLNLDRGIQNARLMLKDVDAQDVTSDTNSSNTRLESRQIVATFEVAMFLGGDAGRIVELAVGCFFGGRLLGTQHQGQIRLQRQKPQLYRHDERAVVSRGTRIATRLDSLQPRIWRQQRIQAVGRGGTRRPKRYGETGACRNRCIGDDRLARTR